MRDGLHELSRKELVRPARSSSMEGESEFAFWHALVRDVCYGQIPRAARAAKHRQAAAWIERQAPERVEDLAEVLAHHYVHALELTRAAGQSGEATELEASALRFLLLSGDRSLGLDTARRRPAMRRRSSSRRRVTPQRAGRPRPPRRRPCAVGPFRGGRPRRWTKRSLTFRPRATGWRLDAAPSNLRKERSTSWGILAGRPCSSKASACSSPSLPGPSSSRRTRRRQA